MSSDISSDIPPLTKDPNPLRDEFIKNVKLEAEQKEQDKNGEKEKQIEKIFECFSNKNFPSYEEFNPYDPQDLALGYGAASKRLGFKPALVAEWIRENENFKTDINTGILYFFDGKRWIQNAEPYLEYLVNLILGQDTKINHYRNIEFALKAKTYSTIEFSKKLALENGLLDLESLQFKEYGPESIKDMAFFYIPVKYDPKATCPKYDEFVKSIVKPDDIATLDEWSGYLLFPEYRFQNMMWMVGRGRNGKGVWQRTMTAILGADNVSNLGLEEFDGRHQFSIANLYGKLANFSSEPKAKNSKGEPLELPTNLLKFATGQDDIEAEIKNKQKRLKFTNAAKITILANKFPRITDNTDAFKERRLFLEFPYQFVGKDQIQNIESAWLSGENNEKSGIFNRMLKGLQRLLVNGDFTKSLSQKEAELKFLRASNSVAAFIIECGTFNRNIVSTRTDAKEAYENYCEFYGLEVENEKVITAEIRSTAHVKPCWAKINGKSERAWSGITFNKLELPNEKDLQKTDEQLTLDTLATPDTRIHDSIKNTEVSENIEKVETRVLSVSGVSVSDSSKKGQDKQPVPAVPTVPEKKSVMRFQRVNSRVESHKCDNPKCENERAILAELKQVLDAETAKELGKDALYFCPDCFKNAKANAEKDGVKFVEVPMDEPKDDYREGF